VSGWFLDSAALDAAFAAPPYARDSGPEQKAAASGNRCQAWPRRDDRPPIRFEDTPVFAPGTNRWSFGSGASGLLMMKGAGRVNADARRATVSPAAGLRIQGWTTHRFSSPHLLAVLSCRSSARPAATPARQSADPVSFALVHTWTRTLLSRRL
jgi:hypothetical protein